MGIKDFSYRFCFFAAFVASMPFCAFSDESKVFMGSKKIDIDGYPLINISKDNIYTPGYQHVIAAYDKNNINTNDEIYRSGSVIFDKTISVDGKGSWFINSESDTGLFVQFPLLKLPSLKGSVYWVKILAKASGVTAPVSIDVVTNKNSDYMRKERTSDEKRLGSLFAGVVPSPYIPDLREFEWSYYIHQIETVYCRTQEPLDNMAVSFFFRGKGKVWIDKIELVDIGVRDQDYYSTSVLCLEDDGAHKD